MTTYDPHFAAPPLPPPPSKKPGAVAIVIMALLALAAILTVFAAVDNNTPAVNPPRAQYTPAPTPAPSSGGMPTPQTAADYNQADYRPISDHDLAVLLKDPDANKGSRLILYGAVTQADAATGTHGFRASVAGEQHSYAYQYNTNPLIGAESASTIADVVAGDQVMMYADVVGSYSYDTAMGGKITAPVFRVVMLSVLSHGQTR